MRVIGSVVCAVIFLMGGLITLQGCATSSEGVETLYDDDYGVSMFKAQPVRIVRQTGGLGSVGRQVIYIHALAQCPGAECTPEVVHLRFIPGATGSRNLVWLDYDDVEFRADEWEYTFQGVSKRTDHHLASHGELLRVSLPLDDFRKMLRTRSLTIQIGNTMLGLSFDQLESFRELAVALMDEKNDEEELL